MSEKGLKVRSNGTVQQSSLVQVEFSEVESSQLRLYSDSEFPMTSKELERLLKGLESKFQQLQDSVKQLEQRQDSKPSESRKWWLALIPIGALLTLFFTTILPSIITSQTSGVTSDVSSLKTSVGMIKDDVAGINKKLDAALNRAYDRAIEASKNPKASVDSKRNGLILGNSAIQVANDIYLPLDPKALTKFADVAAEISRTDPVLLSVAWESTELSATQRTIQPSAFARVQGMKWSLIGDTLALSSPVFGADQKGVKVYATDTWVPFEKAAVFTPFEYYPVLASKFSAAQSDALLVGQGHSSVVILDDSIIRNTTMQNVRIVYRGGPVRLTNVSFVNCEFDILPGQMAAQLASAILKNDFVTLREEPKAKSPA